MATINMVVTTAGLAALASAVQAGNAFEIDSVQIGTGQYTPTSAATALVTPFSPPRTFMNPSGNVQGSTASFGFTDDGGDAYNVGEVGVFSGATLFAIASRPTAGGFLFAKQVTAPLLVSVHSVWSGVTNISSITFADAPAVTQATTGAPGIVELATQAEVNALSDSGRAVTPGNMPIASSTQQGVVELASNTETNGSSGSRAVTPGGLVSSRYQQVWGSDSAPTANEVAAMDEGDLWVEY